MYKIKLKREVELEVAEDRIVHIISKLPYEDAVWLQDLIAGVFGRLNY